MNEVIEDIHPTTAVNGSPEVMGELLELDPKIADEIMYLVAGVENYRNIRLPKGKLFELSLEAEPDSNVVARLIDYLIRFIKRFLKDVSDGGAILGLNLGKVVNRAELINTASRTRSKTNRAETFDITTRVANLSINYRPISDPQQLLMLLKSTDQLFKAYFRYQAIDLPNVIPFLATIRPEDPESLFNLTELLRNVSPMTKGQSLGMTATESGMVSSHLLGNQRLHVINKYATGDAVEQLVGQEFLILPSSDNPRPQPASITYSVFGSTIEQSILRQVIATGRDLESSFGIITRNRRATRVDDLTRYLDSIRNRINSGQLDPESLERANQIVRLLEVYATWLINPYLNLMALYIRNMSAILNVCDANN